MLIKIVICLNGNHRKGVINFENDNLIYSLLHQQERSPPCFLFSVHSFLSTIYYHISNLPIHIEEQTPDFSFFFLLLPLISRIFLCLFENMIAFFHLLCVLVHVCIRIYGSESTTGRSLLSLFTIWVLGIKLGSLCCGDASFLLRHLSDPPEPSYQKQPSLKI